MQRIYKHYDLPLAEPAIRLRRQSCSSYAGGRLADPPPLPPGGALGPSALYALTSKRRSDVPLYIMRSR